MRTEFQITEIEIIDSKKRNETKGLFRGNSSEFKITEVKFEI